MAEKFLALQTKERKEILDTAALTLPFPADLLEKDVWVCWCLQKLFSMPDKYKMAFKGGTSLSKVFDIIKRFSDDVDITIDFPEFEARRNQTVSGSAVKKLRQDQEKRLDEYLKIKIKPYLEKMAEDEFGSGVIKLNLPDEGDKLQEKLELEYESVTDSVSPYMKKAVRLEFGARNLTEPNKEHEVVTYLQSAKYEALLLPGAYVTVLVPERTFWEKATLIHEECHRMSFKPDAERISRHWYDLRMLLEHRAGAEALQNKQLMQEVVYYKQKFYRSSHCNYNDCLSQRFRLIPNSEAKELLRADYNEMRRLGYFAVDPPSFDSIMETLTDLESELNK